MFYIDESQEVGTLHMGSSKYIILRRSSDGMKIVNDSAVLINKTSFPYNKGSYGINLLNHKLNPGDIIITGSDGLWNNVNKTEVISIVKGDSMTLKEIADRIAFKAREVVIHKRSKNQVNKKQKESEQIDEKKKLADISVVVARVVTSELNEHSRSMKRKEDESFLLYSVFKWVLITLCTAIAFLFYTFTQVPDDMTYRGWITRPISRIFGQIGGITVPRFLRTLAYGSFCKYYKINTSEILYPLSEFKNFKEFFTRKLKEGLRPFAEPSNDSLLCSPADATVLASGEVKDDKIYCVKGHTYPIGEMLYGKEYAMATSKELFPSLSKDPSITLYYVVLYLSPSDYHRYHSPTSLLLKERCHVIGYLNPVKPVFLLKNKVGLKDNERVSMFGQWEMGEMVMTFVGALNVGCMDFHFDPEVKTNMPDPSISDYSLRKDYRESLVENKENFEKAKRLGNNWSEIHECDIKTNYKEKASGIFVNKGEEMGMFNFGSTIVMIFCAKKGQKFMFETGSHLKVGQPIFPEPSN